MKHRGGAEATGLGGGAPELIPNTKTTGSKVRDDLIRQASKEAYELFFKGTALDYGGVDAGIQRGEVRIGVEPTYMYESLKMLVLEERKDLCRLVTGYAWEAWGSGIRSTERRYSDYLRKSKFVRFVDMWHGKIFETA